ncbi:MAG: arylsulfatase A [Marinoscillum sp.]|jgi:arylsulfatase A
MATLANITGIDLPVKAALNSYDFTAVLKGEVYNSSVREATVHNTYASKWGLRQGDWLYINDSTGGHRKNP